MRQLADRGRGVVLLLLGGVLVAAIGPADAQVSLAAAEGGGFVCTTPQYEARVSPDGTLRSLRAGGAEFLTPAEEVPGAAFVSGGQLLALRSLRQEGADTLVAEGEPKEPAQAVPNSPCPFTARITYHFLPDHLELRLEQSLDQYGGFAWVPSAEVLDSRDSPTDCATRPGGPAPYGQTDPRWTTASGPVLRFDFGVWQRGFANANWGAVRRGDASVPYLVSTVPAAGAIVARVYPLPAPTAAEALTFDITASDPDFLLRGGPPVRFRIAARNAGPRALAATVRFEVRDYLTQQPVAARTTTVKLPAGANMLLPTEVPVREPGPYRAAIVVEQPGVPPRTISWVFTYDFVHYAPATTRQPNFQRFWDDALAESARLPLDPRLVRAPDKDTAATEAFRVSFATLAGRRIHGWYSRPKAPGKYPAQVRYPSSGIYPLPGPESSPDRCALWIQIHGFDVDLANMPDGDDPGKSYWTAGIASPETSMWRTIYISCVRAVDFMVAQPEVDAERVAVVGGSQGGGLAMAAAALDPRVKLCLPYHSGLPRLDWTVRHEPGYWPFTMAAKPAGQSAEEFLRTLSYFDPANLTQDIRCPVVAEVGMMDTVTASGNQICALAHVPQGQLYLVCSPWATHGGGSRDPQLCAQAYDRFLKGEPAIPKPTR